MALRRDGAGRVRDASGRFARTPGRQFATVGGRAAIPILPETRVVTTQVPIIVAAINRAVSKVTAYIAQRCTERLIETTPVDTGFARASWIPSVGVRSTQVGGSPQSVSQAAQDLGLAKLTTYDVSQGPVFVSNNVPYIMRLNSGWSQQAPIGFIEYAREGAVADAKAAFGKL